MCASIEITPASDKDDDAPAIVPTVLAVSQVQFDFQQAAWIAQNMPQIMENGGMVLLPCEDDGLPALAWCHGLAPDLQSQDHHNASKVDVHKANDELDLHAQHSLCMCNHGLNFMMKGEEHN